jgi:hypothetical protein
MAVETRLLANDRFSTTDASWDHLNLRRSRSQHRTHDYEHRNKEYTPRPVHPAILHSLWIMHALSQTPPETIT